MKRNAVVMTTINQKFLVMGEDIFICFCCIKFLLLVNRYSY